MRHAGLRRWSGGFLLIFVLLAAWSLATPEYAAPDESVHAIRAASLVRGEILGQDVSVPGDPSTRVTVPKTLTVYSPACFAFKIEVAASCMPRWSKQPGTARVNTYTGRYPPLYYLAVGLPTLVNTGGSMLLWMRLAGDLVNAAFLAGGFWLLGRGRRSWWAVAGAAAAVTPMVLFIGAVINPSGLEICSAFALWGALFAFSRAARGAVDRSVLAWAAVSAVVFESTRGLSPVFLLITLAAFAVAVGRPTIRTMIARQGARVAGIVVAAFGVLAAAWVALAGSLRLIRTNPVPPEMGTGSILRAALVKNSKFEEFVGNFGWLDTPAPSWVVLVWALAASVLLVGVVLARAWRTLLVMAALALAVLLIPTAGDVVQARTIGMVSQARYILPLAIGVPILAGVAIRWQGRWSRVAAFAFMAALGLAQFGSFWRTLHRYRTGLGPGLPPGSVPWSPPLGTVAVTVFFVVALVALAARWWRLTRPVAPNSLVSAANPTS